MNGAAVSAHARPPRALAPSAEGPRSPSKPLALAGLCVLALAAIWSLAELVPAIHLKDAVALYEFTTLGRPRLDKGLEVLLELLNPAEFVLWGVALVAVAIARDRPRVAFAVALVLGLAPLSAEELKPLLAHSHDHIGNVSIGAASWPSGHATAATALAICAVLVAPRRARRPVAIVAAAFVLAVCVALLVLAWHMPSDVLGGILLASLWTALAVAGLRVAERLRPTRAALERSPHEARGGRALSAAR